jgi:hypothetical protein
LAVAATGDYAFLSVPNEADYGSKSRIEVIDLRTPNEPKLVGTYATAGAPTGLAIHGQHLLVGQQGLVVLDVSNPANPQPVGRYNSTKWINRVAVSGTRAYVTGGAGFQVFDLSNPTQPLLLGSNPGLGSIWIGLATSGNYVYGAKVGSGVQVVDISDPANPRLAGGNSATVASDLVISGNHVFVAGDSDGLQVFDLALSNTQDPPGLGVLPSGSSLRITWPTNATGFILQSATSLANGADWQDSGLTSTVVGDQNVVTVGATNATGFFRLRKM